MNNTQFETFFQGKAMEYLQRSISLALDEDGPDLTSEAVFLDTQQAHCEIVAKEATLCAGLPITDFVLSSLAPNTSIDVTYYNHDGDTVPEGTTVAVFVCSPKIAFKAERVILNFICHLSGIANLVKKYVDQLGDSRTTLLDTRKTLPGLRYPEKYAVRIGGAKNHRIDLAEMLMLKDNHIDQAGGITPAVTALRQTYSPCPPIEVECRDQNEVLEAVSQNVDRIMLDNMTTEMLTQALSVIPDTIETEVSGGVDFSQLASIGTIGPDYVSVGRLTHSAPAADFSMRVRIKEQV